MNQRQAELLYREMFRRRAVKYRDNGSHVYMGTDLTRMLFTVDAPAVLSNDETYSDMAEDERIKAAAFLRKWANALESNTL